MITVKQVSNTDRVRGCNPRASAHQIVASIGGNAHHIEASADNDIPGHDVAGTRWNAHSGGPALAEQHAIRIRLGNRFRASNPTRWSALAHPTLLRYVPEPSTLVVAILDRRSSTAWVSTSI